MSPAQPTIGQLLKSGTQYLHELGKETARLDAEIILGHILKKNRAELLLETQQIPGENLRSLYQETLTRRGEAQPIAYITGEKEFMSLSFRVGPAVLIPRPETEILVEQLISRYREQQGPLVGVDVGTGSGCIAISLAHYLPRALLFATDVSLSALLLAQENANRLAVASRLEFFASDLFNEFTAHNIKANSLDFIAANPPYIPRRQIDNLMAEVLQEPRLALDGGEDGLDFYRLLIQSAPLYLKEQGVLALEIGAGQACEVTALFNETHHYNFPVLHADLNGHSRVIIAEKKLG